MTLIYYHQRIRRENYDLECMIDAAELHLPLVLPLDAVAAVESPHLEE